MSLFLLACDGKVGCEPFGAGRGTFDVDNEAIYALRLDLAVAVAALIYL
jgi:hypothetical protein